MGGALWKEDSVARFHVLSATANLEPAAPGFTADDDRLAGTFGSHHVMARCPRKISGGCGQERDEQWVTARSAQCIARDDNMVMARRFAGRAEDHFIL